MDMMRGYLVISVIPLIIKAIEVAHPAATEHVGPVGRWSATRN
jgi:hypothetical protein